MLLSTSFLLATLAATVSGLPKPKPKPDTPPLITSTITQADTVTRTSFVLHSTPVASSADHTWYSTWLSVTYWTTTTTTQYPVVITPTTTPSE